MADVQFEAGLGAKLLAPGRTQRMAQPRYRRRDTA